MVFQVPGFFFFFFVFVFVILRRGDDDGVFVDVVVRDSVGEKDRQLFPLPRERLVRAKHGVHAVPFRERGHGVEPELSRERLELALRAPKRRRVVVGEGVAVFNLAGDD